MKLGQNSMYAFFVFLGLQSKILLKDFLISQRYVFGVMEFNISDTFQIIHVFLGVKFAASK